MKLLWLGAAGAAALIFFAASAAKASSGIIEEEPGELKGARLLKDLIKPGAVVHVVYVHGMRAEGPDISAPMRGQLERFLGITKVVPGTRTFIDLGDWPKATYVEQPIWGTDEEWLASRPFVDRYVLSSGKGEVVLDEVNWWPLLFPFKCRFLLRPEHDLSGNDKAHLKLCSTGSATGRTRGVLKDGKWSGGTGDIFYPWLTPAEAAQLLRTRPRSGGGAWPNAPIKRQIMNWGLADAVIALGPMRQYIRQAMNEAFADVDSSGPKNADRVVVSESLGSFAVLDAMKAPHWGVRSFLERTADLYFFANQFALLELARLEGIRASRPHVLAEEAAIEPAPEERSVLAELEKLAPARPAVAPEEAFAAELRPVEPRQVIAFSDPSDMLSWRVPKLKGVKVINLYAATSGGPFRLFANPIKAHRGAITSRRVWKLLLEGKR